MLSASASSAFVSVLSRHYLNGSFDLYDQCDAIASALLDAGILLV